MNQRLAGFHPNALSERGIVLPVVLVMLVLMTIVVLFVSRRGAIDERLAENIRRVVTIDSAASYVLRRCEYVLWMSPPGKQVRTGAPGSFMLAQNMGPADTWRTVNWTTDANELGGGLLNWVAGSAVNQARCLIEDATGELSLPELPSNDANGIEMTVPWRKYRLTAQVRTNGPSGLRIAYAQSEVRMKLN